MTLAKSFNGVITIFMYCSTYLQMRGRENLPKEKKTDSAESMIFYEFSFFLHNSEVRTVAVLDLLHRNLTKSF